MSGDRVCRLALLRIVVLLTLGRVLVVFASLCMPPYAWNVEFGS